VKKKKLLHKILEIAGTDGGRGGGPWEGEAGKKYERRHVHATIKISRSATGDPAMIEKNWGD